MVRLEKSVQPPELQEPTASSIKTLLYPGDILDDSYSKFVPDLFENDPIFFSKWDI